MCMSAYQRTPLLSILSFSVLMVVVENYELKTLLYLLNPTVHKEKKQNKASNGLYSFKVKVSLNRK